MYKPEYGEHGEIINIRRESDGAFISMAEGNKDYTRFKEWLKAEGKTLDQLKAENPYAPEPKTAAEKKRDTIKAKLKAGTATFDADTQKELAELL